MFENDAYRIKAVSICQALLAILCMVSTHIFVRVFESCEGLKVHGLYSVLFNSLWLPMLIPLGWTAAAQFLKSRKIETIYTMYSGLLLMAMLVVFVIVTFTKTILALDAATIGG